MATIHCSRSVVYAPGTRIRSLEPVNGTTWKPLTSLMLLRRRHVSKPSGVLVTMHPFAYLDCMFLVA
jgi:hypothetical protein